VQCTFNSGSVVVTKIAYPSDDVVNIGWLDWQVCEALFATAKSRRGYPPEVHDYFKEISRIRKVVEGLGD
jgi:hypothetical protein